MAGLFYAIVAPQAEYSSMSARRCGTTMYCGIPLSFSAVPATFWDFFLSDLISHCVCLHPKILTRRNRSLLLPFEEKSANLRQIMTEHSF